MSFLYLTFAVAALANATKNLGVDAAAVGAWIAVLLLALVHLRLEKL